MPNALTNVATARPAVSATAATATGITTAVATPAAGQAVDQRLQQQPLADERRCRAAARKRASAPTPNSAVVAGMRGAQAAERVQVAGAGGVQRPTRRPGTAGS